MDERDKVAETVARLREDHNSIWQVIMDEAADLLEALAAQLAEVEAQRDALIEAEHLAHPTMQRMRAAENRANARAEAAESALARLRADQDAMVGAVIEEAARKQDEHVVRWDTEIGKAAGKASHAARTGRMAGHFQAAADLRALRPDAAAALERVRQEARIAALEEAEALRDVIADEIGARPMSSIHGALSEYCNRIRAMKATTP